MFQLNDILRCEKTIKYFARSNKKFRYVLQKWTIIEELVAVLKYAYDATQAIQKQEYSLSDFYASWIKMKLKLEIAVEKESKTNLAFHLYEALKKREASLFNQGMLCAIYLDGRFRKELTADQTALAKFILVTLWERVCALKSEQPSVIENDQIQNISDDILEEYLARKEDESIASSSSVNTAIDASSLGKMDKRSPNFKMNGNQLRICFAEYEKIKRPEAKVSSLQWWETLKNDFPEMYILAIIINGIPPSQTTVERSFSAFSLIVTPKRYNISERLLEDILTIKLNQNMLKNIYDEDLTNLNNERTCEDDTENQNIIEPDSNLTTLQ